VLLGAAALANSHAESGGASRRRPQVGSLAALPVQLRPPSLPTGAVHGRWDGARCGVVALSRYDEARRQTAVPLRMCAASRRRYSESVDSLVRRLRRLAAALIAGAIAFVVTVIMVVAAGHVQAGGRPLDPLAYGLLIVAGGSLAGYRRWPVPVLITTAVAHFCYLVLRYPEGVEWLGILVALLLVTKQGKWRWTVSVAAANGAALIGADVLGGGTLGDDTLPAVISMTTAVLLGLWLRARRALIAEAKHRAEQAERTKEEEARRRVDEERLRIARDVHDTVAHSIATINVQAGTAVHVLDKRPEQAREALVAIKQASAEALRDLRSTLGMLRNVDGTSRAPSPGLAQLDRLVAMAHDAGVETEVDVQGNPRELPSSVDLAAYRILQESVTNVIRHAGPARVAISLTYGSNHLELGVDDDGRKAKSDVSTDGGSGIEGMRERARLLGGSLTAGPRPEGGFRVRARLPYKADS
jgi:signal transduction histidine kinase